MLELGGDDEVAFLIGWLFHCCWVWLFLNRNVWWWASSEELSVWNWFLRWNLGSRCIFETSENLPSALQSIYDRFWSFFECLTQILKIYPILFGFFHFQFWEKLVLWSAMSPEVLDKKMFSIFKIDSKYPRVSSIRNMCYLLQNESN